MCFKRPTGQLPTSNHVSSMLQPAKVNQRQLWDYVNPPKSYPKSASADVDLELRETSPHLPNMVHPFPSVLPLLFPACLTRTRLEPRIHYTTPFRPMIRTALGLLGCCLPIHTLPPLLLFLEYWVCPTLDQPQQQPISTNLPQRETQKRNPNPVHRLMMNEPTLVYPVNVAFYPISSLPPISTPKAAGPKQSHSDSASNSGTAISSPRGNECTPQPISTLGAGSMFTSRLYGRKIKGFNWGSTCIGNIPVNLSRNLRRRIQWLDYLLVLNLLG
jgi:hypothetical protein